ncbi:DNA-binding protein [Rhodococcus sp. IEGM 1366]|uniref:DNA-binding protein n=1 Tax=Rhodococcus sp. IEGM 1366 TaxID=3082223 RepID=UPI002954D574|nr:DNA-binding protein [Rhodococcus sp. IEGM 1366]MDV8065539.1 DNA-binding protein [Rhodococcus sp. IEGM 1366]
MTEIRRVDGVMLSPDDAYTLAESLRLFGMVLSRQGSRLTPRIERLRTQLVIAADARTDAETRTSVPVDDWLPLSAHDLFDTDTAARVLGCSAGNVRDLARRGHYRLTSPAAGGYLKRTPCECGQREQADNDGNGAQ